MDTDRSGVVRVWLIALMLASSRAGFAFLVAPGPQDTRDGSETTATRPTSRPNESRFSNEGFTVVVVNEKTRQPVAGAHVRCVESPLRPAGTDAVADQDGRVQIPAGPRPLMIHASAGDLFGDREVMQPASARVTVVIGPDVSCRARVVDQSGNGVAGIRVDLGDPPGELASGVSSADGFVDLRASRETQGYIRGTFGNLRCDLHVMGPGLARHRFSATPGADGVVKVVLPEFAWLTVVTRTPAGEPVRSTIEVGGFGNRQVASSGTATWPVGLSKSYVVKASVPELKWETSITVDGPRTPGEKASVPLVVTATGPVLVGRLVDQDGVPIKDLAPEVHVLFTAPGGAQGGGADGVSTDSTGRFRVLVEQPKWLATRGRIQLVMKDRTDVGTREEILAAATRPVRQARVDVPLNLAKGDHDLGDVVFKVPPLVAAGVVVDESDRPIRGAYLNVTMPKAVLVRLLRAREPTFLHWENPLGWASAKSAVDGSFEIRGFVDSDEIAVEAEAQGFVDTETPVIQRGARDVRIVMPRK